MFEELESHKGFLEALDGVADHKGKFRDRLDMVIVDKSKCGDGGGSDGRNDSVALEVHVDLQCQIMVGENMQPPQQLLPKAP